MQRMLLLRLRARARARTLRRPDNDVMVMRATTAHSRENERRRRCFVSVDTVMVEWRVRAVSRPVRTGGHRELRRSRAAIGPKSVFFYRPNATRTPCSRNVLRACKRGNGLLSRHANSHVGTYPPRRHVQKYTTIVYAIVTYRYLAGRLKQWFSTFRYPNFFFIAAPLNNRTIFQFAHSNE